MAPTTKAGLTPCRLSSKAAALAPVPLGSQALVSPLSASEILRGRTSFMERRKNGAVWRTGYLARLDLGACSVAPTPFSISWCPGPPGPHAELCSSSQFARGHVTHMSSCEAHRAQALSWGPYTCTRPQCTEKWLVLLGLQAHEGHRD